jgi:hypothetical protein
MEQRPARPATATPGGTVARQEGQAMVEFAMMLPLLLVLAIGILEFGMLFKDHVGIHYAAREGARAGAAAGRNPNADCTILRAVSTTMQTMPYDDLQRVRIFRAADDGTCASPCYENVYIRPGPPSLPCFQAWGLDRGNWPPDGDPGRRNDPPPTDALGVTVQFTHRFFLNFVPGTEVSTIVIEDTAYNQIEPLLFRPGP